jgi:hypothetical protein
MKKTASLVPIVVLAVFAIAPSVKATPLAPGASSSTPDQFSLGYSSSPPAGLSDRTVVASTSYYPTWGGSSGFFGEFYEQVESDPGNVYCSGCLDFRFQVYNDYSSDANVVGAELGGFSSYLTDVGWELESVNSVYECGPDDEGFCNGGDPSEIPTSVYRSPDGNTVGFNFSGVVPDDATVDLVIETNAQSWTDQPLNAFNPAGLEESATAIGPDSVTVPTVPEPSTWVMLVSGLLLVGMARTRRSRNASA